jgi:hypothetical protein
MACAPCIERRGLMYWSKHPEHKVHDKDIPFEHMVRFVLGHDHEELLYNMVEFYYPENIQAAYDDLILEEKEALEKDIEQVDAIQATIVDTFQEMQQQTESCTVSLKQLIVEESDVPRADYQHEHTSDEECDDCDCRSEFTQDDEETLEEDSCESE